MNINVNQHFLVYAKAKFFWVQQFKCTHFFCLMGIPLKILKSNFCVWQQDFHLASAILKWTLFVFIWTPHNDINRFLFMLLFFQQLWNSSALSQDFNATKDPEWVSYISHHQNIETSIKIFHVLLTFWLNMYELIAVINRSYISSLYCWSISVKKLKTTEFSKTHYRTNRPSHWLLNSLFWRFSS